MKEGSKATHLIPSNRLYEDVGEAWLSRKPKFGQRLCVAAALFAAPTSGSTAQLACSHAESSSTPPNSWLDERHPRATLTSSNTQL